MSLGTEARAELRGLQRVAKAVSVCVCVCVCVCALALPVIVLFPFRHVSKVLIKVTVATSKV